MSWEVRGGPFDPHVVPLGDLTEHTSDVRCICGPTLNGDGVWVHHSLDGREFSEPDYRGPTMPQERKQ